MQQNRLQIIALAMILALFTGSCENDPDKIGIEIQPDADKLNVFSTDTLTVTAHSVYVDSVRTDETSSTMIGSYYDPIFGITTSSLYLELRLSTAEIDLGDSPVLDSMVMVLEYASMISSGDEEMVAYGDTTTMQTFRIFEIDESFYSDSIYFSNNTLSTKAAEIGELTFQPQPTDSITIDTTKYKAQLHIKMEDSFVQKFRDASDDDFSSLEKFLEFLKGIYIVPDEISMGGAIMFYNMSSIFSRMTLYYSNADEDSLKYYFPVSSGSARFMNFNHNYTLASPEFQNQLNGDTTLGEQKFFLQSMAGVAAIVEIPYLKTLTLESNIALNEAKLIVINNNKEDEFLPPSELILFNIDDNGTYTLLVDQLEGAEYFGGTYDNSNGQYFFRITQHLQKVLSGDTIPPRFYMGVSGASISPNRAAINGFSPIPPAGNSQKLKLELIFTDLNN